jgi:AdoMet-dependent heme synthase
MTVRALRRTRIDLNRRPFIVIWEATQACVLACKHCRATSVPHRDSRELTTAQACSLMDQVLEFGSPPPFFVITGGDPFMRPDLFELVAHGAAIGLPVAVSPSGTPALNRDNLARLRDAGAHAISLSVDGATAATHDAFRGVPGSFDLTLRGWQEARELGLRVQINTTATPQNLHELPAILDTIKRRGVMTWSMFFLVPTGRGSALQQFTAQQAEDVLNFCYEADQVVSLKTTEAPAFRRVCIQRTICEEQGLDPATTLRLGPDYRALTAQLAALGLQPDGHQLRRPPLPINAARGFVFVSHTGEVFPSGFLPRSAGDVHSRPLAEIYRDSDLFTMLRDTDRPTGRCGRCEFRTVCGGSRPRAYGATGDPLEDDPLCGYEPGTFGFGVRVRALIAG